MVRQAATLRHATTTTGARRARWCVTSWTTRRATGWSSNVAGHAAAVTRDDVLERVFNWRAIDKTIGDRIEAACREAREGGDEVELLESPPRT